MNFCLNGCNKLINHGSSRVSNAISLGDGTRARRRRPEGGAAAEDVECVGDNGSGIQSGTQGSWASRPERHNSTVYGSLRLDIV